MPTSSPLSLRDWPLSLKLATTVLLLVVIPLLLVAWINAREVESQDECPKESFKLLSGEGAMSEYQFNTHNIHHLFCATCGIQSFARGKRPDGAEMVAVNVRCLDEVDVDSLKVKKVDGRKF